MTRRKMLKQKLIWLKLVILLSFVIVSVSAHAGEQAKPKLYVFEVGKMAIPDKCIIVSGPCGQFKPYIIPVYAYLISHPKGLILIDTGLNPDTWPEELRKEIIWSPEQQRIDKQLAKLGYKPEDIKYVIMTHLHLDHAGWMKLFPKSTFVVRQEELRGAWWPDPRIALAYLIGDLEGTRDFQYLELDNLESFDLFLDGSVVCFITNGHTQGHQSVLVNLNKMGKVVLTGDALDSIEMLDRTLLPSIAWSPELALKTIKRLQHMRREGVTIIPSHDPEFSNTLKLAPDYYE